MKRKCIITASSGIIIVITFIVIFTSMYNVFLRQISSVLISVRGRVNPRA
jgi:hypothetical protein